jgi:hypothetical protein
LHGAHARLEEHHPGCREDGELDDLDIALQAGRLQVERDPIGTGCQGARPRDGGLAVGFELLGFEAFLLGDAVPLGLDRGLTLGRHGGAPAGQGGELARRRRLFGSGQGAVVEPLTDAAGKEAATIQPRAVSMQPMGAPAATRRSRAS